MRILLSILFLSYLQVLVAQEKVTVFENKRTGLVVNINVYEDGLSQQELYFKDKIDDFNGDLDVVVEILRFTNATGFYNTMNKIGYFALYAKDEQQYKLTSKITLFKLNNATYITKLVDTQIGPLQSKGFLISLMDVVSTTLAIAKIYDIPEQDKLTKTEILENMVLTKSEFGISTK